MPRRNTNSGKGADRRYKSDRKVGSDRVWRLAYRGPFIAYDEFSGADIEIEIGQKESGRIAGLVIDFRYMASDGETTRRSLSCWQCGRANNRLYVHGYCPFREDLRTFRVDRMTDVIALIGAQDVPVQDIEAFFAAYAADSAEQNATPRLESPDW